MRPLIQCPSRHHIGVGKYWTIRRDDDAPPQLPDVQRPAPTLNSLSHILPVSVRTVSRSISR